jgi:Flp pilus assembly protein protease CpaA
MINPADSMWGLVTLFCLTAAAIEDWRTQHIWPGYHKIGYGAAILAASLLGPMNAVYAAVTGGMWFCGGYILWRLRILGGGDVKLLFPVGAYVYALQIHWLAYLPVLAYTGFAYAILWSAWLIHQTGKLRGHIPFAPVYPLSVIACFLLLKHLGF